MRRSTKCACSPSRSRPGRRAATPFRSGRPREPESLRPRGDPDRKGDGRKAGDPGATPIDRWSPARTPRSMTREGVTLEELRQRLTDIDRQLIELVAERKALSEEVARVKRATGRPTRDYAREREVILAV